MNKGENTMIPLNGFIKVKLIEHTVTPGGVMIPENVQGNAAIWKGEVVDCGSGTFWRPAVESVQQMSVRNGDVVYFRPANSLQTGPNTKEFLVHHDHLIGMDA